MSMSQKVLGIIASAHPCCKLDNNCRFLWISSHFNISSQRVNFTFFRKPIAKHTRLYLSERQEELSETVTVAFSIKDEDVFGEVLGTSDPSVHLVV